MRNKLIVCLLVLMFPAICSAECYVRYDLGNGAIKQLYYSIDAKVMGIYEDADLLYVTPTLYKMISIDPEHYLVKNKNVVAMTEQEKYDYDTAKAAAKAAAAAAAAKVPTLEKLLSDLVSKGFTTIKDVQDAEPIKME